MLIPASEAFKQKTDIVTVPAAVLGWFSTIPWSEIAAFLAAIYTALRIIELLWDRYKKK